MVIVFRVFIKQAKLQIMTSAYGQELPVIQNSGFRLVSGSFFYCLSRMTSAAANLPNMVIFVSNLFLKAEKAPEIKLKTAMLLIRYFTFTTFKTFQGISGNFTTPLPPPKTTPKWF